MHQITDNKRIVYVEDDTQPYEVVYVQRKRRLTASQKAERIVPLLMFPSVFGFFVLIFLCFVVRDVQWLVQRAAAAVAILFLFGMVGTVLLVSYAGIRDFFAGLKELL